MRVFLKNISIKDLELINYLPIHGVIFSIKQNNAEAIRTIVEQIPFYLTIIGEMQPFPKYEIEELIYFCKLKGIISNSRKFEKELSCPIIYSYDLKYNVIINKNNTLQAEQKDIRNLAIYKNDLFALVLSVEELKEFWPLIQTNWSQIKVV